MTNPPDVHDRQPVSAPPFLDLLQQDMEAIALGEDANEGSFCGVCYARIAGELAEGREDDGQDACAVCGAPRGILPPAGRVPNEVLALYRAKRDREGLFVNAFAFLGIFLSLVLSALIWFLTPENWWKVLPFAVLAFGSYYLARLLGYNLGVPLGSRSGRAIRDRRWLTFAAAREAGGAGAVSASCSQKAAGWNKQA